MEEATKFQFEVDGAIQVFPCLEIFAFTDTPRAQAAQAVMRAFSAFVAHTGTPKYVQLNDSTRVRKVRPKDLELFPSWFSDPRAMKEVTLGMDYHSGPSPKEYGPPRFSYKDYELHARGDEEAVNRMMLRFSLPLNEGQPPAFERVWSLVSDALAEFPLRWGYAGLSLDWESGRGHERETGAWIRPLLFRHPGINLPDPLLVYVRAQSGVMLVSWLNLLGAEYLRQLGGLESLRTAAEPTGLEVLPLGDDKAVLRAGDAPQWGDVNRRETLPLYRAAGQILNPLRCSDGDLADLHMDAISSEDTEDRELAWHRRFFDPAES